MSDEDDKVGDYGPCNNDGCGDNEDNRCTSGDCGGASDAPASKEADDESD